MNWLVCVLADLTEDENNYATFTVPRVYGNRGATDALEKEVKARSKGMSLRIIELPLVLARVIPQLVGDSNWKAVEPKSGTLLPEDHLRKVLIALRGLTKRSAYSTDVWYPVSAGWVEQQTSLYRHMLKAPALRYYAGTLVSVGVQRPP